MRRRDMTILGPLLALLAVLGFLLVEVLGNLFGTPNVPEPPPAAEAPATR